MGYVIAVDVGTSRTAAAVARVGSNGEISTSPFALGRHADSVPSSAFALSGELLWGDAAERRGITQPDRLIREFKRRVGDDVPIVAGDQSFTAEQLYARMVAWVVDTVREREGRSPDAVTVTVPVTWGGYRTDLVAGALARAGLGDVVIVSEPEAAARRYESMNPLEPGHALAVYDLGGGTFDAVILRMGADGALQQAGEPTGIADLGGADFDDAVLRHALAVAGFSVAALAADRGARMGVAALRRECVDAKEALSFDSDASIPVLLGERETTVRLTRDEFEAMIEDAIDRTAETLADALESADVPADHVDAILLTGGSSRIPRVAQRLSARFDLPIATDADPKAIIALGAAASLAADRTAAAAGLAAYDDELGAATAAEAAAGDALAPPAAVRGAAPRSWFRRAGAGALSGTGVIALAVTMVTLSASALGGAPVDHALGGGDDAQRAALNLPWAWDGTPAAALPTSDPAAAPLVVAPDAGTGDGTPPASTRHTPGRATPRNPAAPQQSAARSTAQAQPGTAAAPSRPAGSATQPAPAPVGGPPTTPAVDPAPVTEPQPEPAPEPAAEPEPEPTTPEPQPTTPEPDPTAPDPEPTTDPQPADPAPAPAEETSDGSHRDGRGEGGRDRGDHDHHDGSRSH